MLLSGCKLTAVEARDCGLVTDVFSHDKFTEEVQNSIQAMAKLPPPQGRKLNCRISQQGASTMELLWYLDTCYLKEREWGERGLFV